jgi:hypothetical protein
MRLRPSVEQELAERPLTTCWQPLQDLVEVRDLINVMTFAALHQAIRACAKLGVEQEAHPTRWDDLDAVGPIIRQNEYGVSYNANAGPARNAAMVAAGAGMCVAFHRFLARSPGTKDCGRGCGRTERIQRWESEPGVPGHTFHQPNPSITVAGMTSQPSAVAESVACPP